MLTRAERQEREEQLLASYAMKSSASRGRVHPEEPDAVRTCYQRDRDRIVHSNSFRRLEYKTQVFVNHEGDHYRTRLTHTLEATQIARSIGRALMLNEDLIETISLSHDIGHPPFGHAGEYTLRDLMHAHGGFEHNRQALRVVDLLENKYPDHPGLNLSWEVREAMSKHRTVFDQPDTTIDLDPTVHPPLEAQLADIADEIAYDCHDSDDGLKSGMIEESHLASGELWKMLAQKFDAAYTNVDTKIRHSQIIKSLINTLISDVITESERRLQDYDIITVEAVRNCPHRLISFSDRMHVLRNPLRKLLFDELYHHYRVIRMSNKATRFITDLFTVYSNQPALLPPSTHARLAQEDKYRVICDYIAGMTDRFALDEHKKLFEPYERV